MGMANTTQKFSHELGEIYNAEQQILKALPQMISQASDPELKQVFEKHLDQTRQQVQRLDQVWGLLGQKPMSVKCDGMDGILSEGKKTMKDADTDTLRDGVMAGGADKVEHYEISSYAGLILAAQLMGESQIVSLLQQNLNEERWMAQQLEQGAPRLARKALAAEGFQVSGGAVDQLSSGS